MYHFQVNDNTPSGVELEEAVSCLHPFKAGGHTHLRMGHFKQWMWGAYPGYGSKNPFRTDQWMCLFDVVQNMGRTGDIPQ